MMGTWGPGADRWTIAPRLPGLPATEASLTGMESLAITRRADLAAARRDVDVVAGNLGLTRYVAWGDVTVGGHVAKETDGALSVGPTIELPLPIFNQGQPAIASAQARLRQAQRRYDALAVQVRSQVRPDSRSKSQIIRQPRWCSISRKTRYPVHRVCLCLTFGQMVRSA